MLVISNHSPDYPLNCTPLLPITITNNDDDDDDDDDKRKKKENG